MVSLLKGATAALTAAAFWAIAVALYEIVGHHLRSVSLNLMKCALALVLLSATVVTLGQLSCRVETRAVLLLLASGAIGFGIADTALFKSLRDLGARRSLLFMVLCPPLSALIAATVLDEGLGLVEWGGILLTVTGVGWVITERVPADRDRPRGHLLRGAVMGLLYALGQSVGSVLSRAAFTSTDITSLWSAVLRLAAAVICLALWDAATGARPTGTLLVMRTHRLWRWLLPAMLLGTYGGVWLQQTALFHLRTGIAQTVLGTSPVFALAVARARGEHVSIRAVLGAVMALAGIAVLLIVPDVLR